jgi:enediyne biosynthesis protein E4
MSQREEILDEVPEPELHKSEERDAAVGVAARWSLVVFAAAGLVAGAVVWWFRAPVRTLATPPSEIAAVKVRDVPVVRMPRVPFTDVTDEAGIAFVHESGAYGDKLLPETMGGGCAFFDFDGDGHQDLLLINSQRWPWDPRPPVEPATLALYRNDGHGRFTDVTEAAGLNVSLFGMGVAVGDFDNDGHVDLFVTAVGEDRLFRNTGRGTFVDVTHAAGVGGGEDWSTSCGWFDYDNDGDLDLFVCVYLQWSKDADLVQDFQLTGGGRAYGRPQDFEGTLNRLYRNDGDGRFTDVSAESGIQVFNPLTGRPMGKSLGVTFYDFDRDGWLDIVVANDTVQNFLFHNQQDGTFREIGMMAGVAFDMAGAARGAMGIDAGRFRNSDAVGIAIGNFANEATALFVSYGPHLRFIDEAIPTGLGPATRNALTFGVFYFDCDLDGRLDLFAANGHLESDINRVQRSQHYAQPPQLFWNAGPEQATEFCLAGEEHCGPDLLRPLVGRGAAFADIDNDGDLDVLVTGIGQQPRLLRNDQQTGHHWLRVRLEGVHTNRDAIGARVELEVAGRTLSQQVMPTRSYLSQVELPVTFGLGNHHQIAAARVIWPDGTVQSIAPPAVDQTVTVREDPALRDSSSAEDAR